MSENSYGNVIFRSIHNWIKSLVILEKDVFFCFEHGRILHLYIFGMAVYIAIESHRLYFHLANSKQLNYTWKYKVNIINVLYVIVGECMIS